MIEEEKEINAIDTNYIEHSLDQEYWSKRWENSETGWDIGYASKAITDYMIQYPNKDASILIPGCGNAYEAEFLLANGFNNITLIDIAPQAVKLLQNKFMDQPQIKIVCEDFFLHKNKYDLILEQTFFCAIDPSQRKQYAEHSAELLNENGKIIGVLFDKIFDKPGPPFGGFKNEYQLIFDPHFIIKNMDACYNSISPRAGTEVFINMVKKKSDLVHNIM